VYLLSACRCLPGDDERGAIASCCGATAGSDGALDDRDGGIAVRFDAKDHLVPGIVLPQKGEQVVLKVTQCPFAGHDERAAWLVRWVIVPPAPAWVEDVLVEDHE
jgi:hypothetical protein